MSARRVERIFAALAAGVVGTAAHAYPDGAPPGVTGGFGESTCAACHLGDPTAAPAVLEVEQLGERYEAGKTYAFELVLRAPQQRIAGFQATARFGGGHREGKQAGALKGDQDGVEVESVEGLEYVGHADVTRLPQTGDAARWQLRWVAPSTADSPVVFHFVAVAGDDDASPLGDRVYVLEHTLEPVHRK